jgi:glycosyltransferase involved in cell wall biosynthesis
MTTHRLVPSAVVCVPASQRADYAKIVGAGRVLTHPDSVKGLTPKLNWIFDHVRDREAIVLVDDDIASLQRCFVEPGEESTIRDPLLIEEIIRATFIMARDIGAFYFGWEASNGALRYYTGLKPFMLTGYINGCAMGFRTGHGLRFDPRIVAKNDFDIAAANAHRHRMCFKNCRYTFCQKETFTGKGGQAAFRTSATEKNDVDLLRRKWGDVFNFGGHSGTRKRDYAGVQKITLNLPF